MNRVDASDEFLASGRSVITGTRQPVRDAVEEALGAALEPERDGVRCLLSRLTAGLGVQALVKGDETFITVTLNGETETFPVPRDRLLDAFDHPYAYGATLPL